MTELNKRKLLYFEQYLKEDGCSENTIKSYIATATYFLSEYDSVTSENLIHYRNYLLYKNKSSTINQRINAINRFIKFEDIGVKRPPLVKIQKNTVAKNIITQEEYDLLKSKLLQDKKYKVYFLIRFMASTGMRISEVLELKVEDIISECFAIKSKGNKERLIFIPSILSRDALIWIDSCELQQGYVFTNRNGKKLTSSGARYLIKHYGVKYGIPESHLHPHAFRHRFALNFIDTRRDISMLSDLLGHESIETTRIYLKKSSDEQKRMIDQIVNW